jgi:PAS domain S-box-containing protein
MAYPQALFIRQVLITKLQSNEQTLQETEGQFQTLFEESPIAIELWNAYGELVEVNPACLDLFGVMEPMDLKRFNLFADRNLSKEMKENLRNGLSVQYEAPFDFEKVKSHNFYQTKHSGIIQIHTEITPLKKEKTRNAGKYLVYVQDITGHKQAMQVLRGAYEDALQVSEMKSNLLSFASHELKTPLVPIIGWVGFLKSLLEKGKKIEDHFGMEDVLSILHACERLDKSVSKFLDLGRLESKRLVLQQQDHSLATLFANSLESVAQLAQSRDIVIQKDIPDCQLHVDGFRMEEVFINILTNAIKYSPTGSHVSVSAHVNGALVIKFHDEGIGFTEDQLKNVWRPFSTSNLQNKSDGMPSTGIGLFLSKGIVEQHGGTIAITSPGPGKGSTVSISLPPETILNLTTPQNIKGSREEI